MHYKVIIYILGLILFTGCIQTQSSKVSENPRVRGVMVSENPGFRGAMTITGQNIQYPKTTSPEIIATILNFSPGEETGWHKHPVPTYTQVINGTLTIDLENGETMEFPSGSGLLDTMNTWHNGRNTGDTNLQVVVIILGEKGKQNLIRRLPQQ